MPLTKIRDRTQETADWKVYVLRDPPSETVSRSSGSDPDEHQTNVPQGGG
jgi:hypothetical protein